MYSRYLDVEHQMTFDLTVMTDSQANTYETVEEEIFEKCKKSIKEIMGIDLVEFTKSPTQLSLIKEFHLKRYIQFHKPFGQLYLCTLIELADEIQQKINSSNEYRDQLKVRVITSDFKNSIHLSYVVVYPTNFRKELTSCYSPLRLGIVSNQIARYLTETETNLTNKESVSIIYSEKDITKLSHNRIQSDDFFDQIGNTDGSLEYIDWVTNCMNDTSGKSNSGYSSITKPPMKN